MLSKFSFVKSLEHSHRNIALQSVTIMTSFFKINYIKYIMYNETVWKV